MHRPIPTQLADALDVIVAPATPPGGALALVRLSGQGCLLVIDALFKPAQIGVRLADAAGHSLHFGRIWDGDSILDEVVVSVFRAPRSFTREDVAEISCHGSPYVLQRLIQLLCAAGARPAEPGEFTRRAFLNGAMDLAQAEAVADLIAAESAAAQQLAMTQLRGGVSHGLGVLREQLLQFAALLELELDFSEEDVEFADRSQLLALIDRSQAQLRQLADSFAAGNALKTGIPTVILGKPNAGKSTLLNALLQENRAIVSEIPGTTRDVIEDTLMLGGYAFRLTDTAGLRDEAADVVEAEGIRRSMERAAAAAIALHVYDAQDESLDQAMAWYGQLQLPETLTVLHVANKIDLLAAAADDATNSPNHQLANSLAISASKGTGVAQVVEKLIAFGQQLNSTEGTLISGQRHYHALRAAEQALSELGQGLQQGLSGEMVALDLRLALRHIGEITGEVSSDEVLGAIFSKFCIGK